MITQRTLLWTTALYLAASSYPARAATPPEQRGPGIAVALRSEMQKRVETEFGHYWTAGPPRLFPIRNS
jgi:hypothetical protein